MNLSTNTVDPELPPGMSWLRISIIMTSFNQGAYLEKTIRSALLQGYELNALKWVMDVLA